MLDDLDLSPTCCEAIARASQLLVEFSTFPMYCRDHSAVMDTYRSGEKFGRSLTPVLHFIVVLNFMFPERNIRYFQYSSHQDNIIIPFLAWVVF